MNVLVSTRDMPRDEWLAWRRRGIGGSDAAAIAGLNPWKSPVAVWLEKTGQIEPEEPGEAAYWGTVLEDLIAREFAARTGCKVRRRNAILQHSRYPFMLANLDREVRDPERGRGILEVKTAGERRTHEWEQGVPEYYLIQVQHYLAVTGYQFAYVAVLIGGQRYLHRLVERDEEIIRYLVQIEADFWRLVETRTPPPMDGSDASAELIARLYPESRPEKIRLPADAEALIAEYEQAKAEEKAAAARAEAAANKLKMLLGEAEEGLVGERRVIWRTIESERLDTKALKAAYPDIAAKFIKTTAYRRFEVK